MTHPSRLRANETDRECAIRRSASRAYTGNGVSNRLHEDQVGGFCRQVEQLQEASGFSAEWVAWSIGLRGEAAAQVLAALEAE